MTTLNAVKSFLESDVETWEAAWDNIISGLISGVSAQIQAYCNREFERVERISYHDGGGRYLYLTETPVQEVAEILYAYDWEWAAATEYGTADYALVNAQAGMVGFKGGAWPEGAKVYRVTYTGGYDLASNYGQSGVTNYTAIPADLEKAARLQVVYEFRRRKDLGLQSISFPDGSINTQESGEFLKQVKATLDRYRRRNIG